MNFRFQTGKATEAACLFLQKGSGRMNIMKLVKLIYLLDRLSLEKRGIPVVAGTYFSLPNGPITSEFLDLINSGCLSGEANCRRHITATIATVVTISTIGPTNHPR